MSENPYEDVLEYLENYMEIDNGMISLNFPGIKNGQNIQSNDQYITKIKIRQIENYIKTGVKSGILKKITIEPGYYELI